MFSIFSRRYSKTMAAIWVIGIFCLIGPPVGFWFLYQRWVMMLMAPFFSYYAVGLAFFAGVVQFLEWLALGRWTPFLRRSPNRWRCMGIGFLLGILSSFLGPTLNNLVMGHQLIWGAGDTMSTLLSLVSGPFCGMISAPGAVRRLNMTVPTVDKLLEPSEKISVQEKAWILAGAAGILAYFWYFASKFQLHA